MLIHGGQQLQHSPMANGWQNAHPAFMMQQQYVQHVQQMPMFDPIRPPPPQSHHPGRPPEVLPPQAMPHQMTHQMSSLPDWFTTGPITVPVRFPVPQGTTVPGVPSMAPTAPMGTVPIGIAPLPSGCTTTAVPSPGMPILAPFGNLPPDSELARLILSSDSAAVPQSGTGTPFGNMPMATTTPGATTATINAQPTGGHAKPLTKPAPAANCQPVGNNQPPAVATVGTVNVKPKITPAQPAAVNNEVGQPAGTKEMTPDVRNQETAVTTDDHTTTSPPPTTPATGNQILYKPNEPAVAKSAAGTTSPVVTSTTPAVTSTALAVTSTIPAVTSTAPTVNMEIDDINQTRTRPPTPAAVASQAAGRNTPPAVSNTSTAATNSGKTDTNPPTGRKSPSAVGNTSTAATTSAKAGSNIPAGRKASPALKKTILKPPPLPWELKRTSTPVPAMMKAKKMSQIAVTKAGREPTKENQPTVIEKTNQPPVTPVTEENQANNEKNEKENHKNQPTVKKSHPAVEKTNQPPAKENQPTDNNEKNEKEIHRSQPTVTTERSHPAVEKTSPTVTRAFFRPDGIVDPRRIRREPGPIVEQKKEDESSNDKEDKKMDKGTKKEKLKKKPTWEDLFEGDSPAPIKKRRRPVQTSDSESDEGEKRSRGGDADLPSLSRETITSEIIKGNTLVRETINRETFALPPTPPSSNPRSCLGSPRSDSHSLPSFGSTSFVVPQLSPVESRRVHFEMNRTAERRRAPRDPKREEAMDTSQFFEPTHNCVGHDCDRCEEMELLEDRQIRAGL